MLAATLQRLAVRLDARACQATEGPPAVRHGDAFAGRNELRSAA